MLQPANSEQVALAFPWEYIVQDKAVRAAQLLLTCCGFSCSGQEYYPDMFQDRENRDKAKRNLCSQEQVSIRWLMFDGWHDVA